MAKIDAFFNLMFEQKASDLHLASGNPPMLRINGAMQRIDYPPLEVVRSKISSSFSKGVVTHQLNDIPTRITNPARSVVDCFKYRSRVGLDACLEALKDILSKGVKPMEIMDYAKAQRVTSVIRPYLDALV